MADLLRIPVDRELRDRVVWLVTLRWFAVLFAALVLVVAHWWFGGALPIGALAVTIASVGVYNLIFFLVTRRLTSHAAPPEADAWLMHAQIATDLVALTILLHFSGGLENPFSIYYVLFVAVGSILTTKRASYAYASVATVLWILLLAAEALGLVTHYNLVGFRLPVRYREVSHVVAEALVLATANYGMAYFASSTIERLRERETQLYQANASCEARAGELRVLNERLRELDETRALFIRLVTHELRAPVAAIKSYLRLILDGYVPQERFMEIIAKTEQRAGEQLELIEDLLDLARISKPKAEEYVPVDLVSVLGDVIDMLRARIADRRIELSLHIAEEPCVVLADPDHIKQVWTNLLSNALKYTPEGGQVSVSLRRANGLIRGEVTDTGIGIKAEDQARIFEAFYRTEEAKAMCRQGTGLGLSIVKGVADLYGGRVWLESVPGAGSTFFFELMAAEP